MNCAATYQWGPGARFRTPSLATVIIGVLAVIGTWIYILGSSSVQNSFDTIAAVDGLLFALFYAFTGVTMVVYFRRMARAGPWNAVSLLVIPVICTAFLCGPRGRPPTSPRPREAFQPEAAPRRDSEFRVP